MAEVDSTGVAEPADPDRGLSELSRMTHTLNQTGIGWELGEWRTPLMSLGHTQRESDSASSSSGHRIDYSNEQQDLGLLPGTHPALNVSLSADQRSASERRVRT